MQPYNKLMEVSRAYLLKLSKNISSLLDTVFVLKMRQLLPFPQIVLAHAN